MRGSKLTNNCGLTSTSSLASSASLGCSGNESDDDLHVLTAQVRKFSVRTFILACMLLYVEAMVCWVDTFKSTKKLRMPETGRVRDASNEVLDDIWFHPFTYYGGTEFSRHFITLPYLHL